MRLDRWALAIRVARILLGSLSIKNDSAAAPAYPDGLTRREVEVWQLVAAGSLDQAWNDLGRWHVASLFLGTFLALNLCSG